MKNILEEFAKGNITTQPRHFKRDSHYAGVLQQVADSEEKLLAVLDEAQKKLFQAFCKAQLELDDLSNIDRFTYGYRLGSLMMMEVFNGKDDLMM